MEVTPIFVDLILLNIITIIIIINVFKGLPFEKTGLGPYPGQYHPTHVTVKNSGEKTKRVPAPPPIIAMLFLPRADEKK